MSTMLLTAPSDALSDISPKPYCSTCAPRLCAAIESFCWLA
jgi:hypothetical protein